MRCLLAPDISIALGCCSGALRPCVPATLRLSPHRIAPSCQDDLPPMAPMKSGMSEKVSNPCHPCHPWLEFFWLQLHRAAFSRPETRLPQVPGNGSRLTAYCPPSSRGWFATPSTKSIPLAAPSCHAISSRHSAQRDGGNPATGGTTAEAMRRRVQFRPPPPLADSLGARRA